MILGIGIFGDNIPRIILNHIKCSERVVADHLHDQSGLGDD